MKFWSLGPVTKAFFRRNPLEIDGNKLGQVVRPHPYYLGISWLFDQPRGFFSSSSCRDATGVICVSGWENPPVFLFYAIFIDIHIQILRRFFSHIEMLITTRLCVLVVTSYGPHNYQSIDGHHSPSSSPLVPVVISNIYTCLRSSGYILLRRKTIRFWK